MTVPQSNEIHQQWGPTITEYPKFYSNASLSGNSDAPVDEADRAIGRDVALRTIEQICMMDHSSIEEPCNTELVNYITLEQLRCISKLARCPGELDNFALPRLVAGCVTLMLSIKPSPFHYEYGYLCFRIIVIAINTCLLKHGRDSTEPLRIPTYFPNNYLTDLWTETAILLKAELAGYSEVFFEKTDMRSGPRTAPYLEALRLDVLLALLHDNQKNFTILLKEANSLGLSGLMYVLLKFVEKNKADMSEEQYQERFLIPYTRIFYRYRLFVPDFPFELDTVRWIYNAGLLVGDMCGRPPNVDREDSRNIIEAFSKSMKTREPTKLPDCLGLIDFVATFMVPGCEDLVAGVFEAAIQVVWSWVSSPEPPEAVLKVLATLLAKVLTILKEFNISHTDREPWMDSLLDSFFDTDLLGLVLRITLAIPTQCYHGPEGILRYLVQASMELMEHIPNDHLKARLRDSGTLWVWRKYLIYFGSSSLRSPSHSDCTEHYECTNVIIHIFQNIWADQWADELSAVQPLGICGNPRCPFPYAAEFACRKHSTPYCSARCQGLGSIYALPMSPDETETLGGASSQCKAPPSWVNPLVYVIDTVWPEHAGVWGYN